jgi:1-deoxy-D-xylulose-5-phosphate reductoisomerase
VKKIGILGSTGSIGLNALQVVRDQKESFRVTVLAAGSNEKLLEEQAREFRPELVALADSEKGPALAKKLEGEKIRVVWGEEGLLTAATWDNMEQVLFAIVGSRGLKPLCEAIQAGKDVAVANKEPMVIAGPLIQKLVAKHRIHLIPVDSEHSAIWQCLEGHRKEDLRRVHLTASGGPFFGASPERLETVTVEDALKHPRWQMGKKITIDSATLMNKGLEVIEAVNLFGLEPSEIKVVIHPEAIIHSMVEFQDGSLLAQLSITDMKLPIQYALSYPRRLANRYPALNLAEIGRLTFFEPDFKKFPALELAFEAARSRGTVPAVLNAANEAAVRFFLDEKIKFNQIMDLVRRVVEHHTPNPTPDLNDILQADRWARREIEEMVYGRVAL